MEGADRHHLARRPARNQRGGSRLGRDHAPRRHRRSLRPQGGRERRRRSHRRRGRRGRPCRALVALRSRSGDTRLVRRTAGPLGRDRERRRCPRRAGGGCRPRLCRLALHRDRGSQRARRLQAGDRRRRRGRYRLHRPLHRRSRQLSALLDREFRARPGQSRRDRPDGDEIRLGRRGQGEGMARYLGLGPGYRRNRPGPPGCGIHRLACRSICRGEVAPLRELERAASGQAALEAPHQRPRRALRHFNLDRSFVEPFHPRIKVGAGIDQFLRGLGQLRDHRLVAVLRVTQPPLRPPPVAVRNLAGFDRALGQQPGDDVHDPGRDLERFARKADPCERLKGGAVAAAGVVEVGTSLIRQQHRLGVKRVDQPRGDPRLRSRVVRFFHARETAMLGRRRKRPATPFGVNRQACPRPGQRRYAMMSGMFESAIRSIRSFSISFRRFIRAISSWSPVGSDNSARMRSSSSRCSAFSASRSPAGLSLLIPLQLYSISLFAADRSATTTSREMHQDKLHDLWFIGFP